MLKILINKIRIKLKTYDYELQVARNADTKIESFTLTLN